MGGLKGVLYQDPSVWNDEHSLANYRMIDLARVELKSAENATSSCYQVRIITGAVGNQLCSGFDDHFTPSAHCRHSPARGGPPLRLLNIMYRMTDRPNRARPPGVILENQRHHIAQTASSMVARTATRMVNNSKANLTVE